MANITMAVIYNLIAVFILIGGIFSALHNGARVTLVKLAISLGGVVGAYFLTPIISNKFYGIEGMGAVLKDKIS